MKIIQETPQQMVLKQSGLPQIIIGIIFAFTGGLTGWLVFSGNAVQQNTLIAQILGVIFILAGIAAIITAEFITITIYKSSNRISLYFASLKRKKTEEIPVDQIEEVALEESMSSSTRSGTRRNFSMVFCLKNGKDLPFPLGSASSGLTINGFYTGLFTGENRHIAFVQKVAAYMGVPFIQRRPPGVDEVLSTITKTIQNQMNQHQPLPENPPSVPPQSPPLHA